MAFFYEYGPKCIECPLPPSIQSPYAELSSAELVFPVPISAPRRPRKLFFDFV